MILNLLFSNRFAKTVPFINFVIPLSLSLSLSFFLVAINATGQPKEDCTDPRCEFDIGKLGQYCTPPHFGYDLGEPCVLVNLNRVSVNEHLVKLGSVLSSSNLTERIMERFLSSPPGPRLNILKGPWLKGSPPPCICVSSEINLVMFCLGSGSVYRASQKKWYYAEILDKVQTIGLQASNIIF